MIRFLEYKTPDSKPLPLSRGKVLLRQTMVGALGIVIIIGIVSYLKWVDLIGNRQVIVGIMLGGAALGVGTFLYSRGLR